MGQLLVRDIEEEVVRELKMRAASKGISAEAEHREILRKALLSSRSRGTLKDRLSSMPDVGTDEDFEFERDLDRRD
ncbi:MAG: DNA-binding protein [Myxococcota bacterium]